MTSNKRHFINWGQRLLNAKITFTEHTVQPLPLLYKETEWSGGFSSYIIFCLYTQKGSLLTSTVFFPAIVIFPRLKLVLHNHTDCVPLLLFQLFSSIAPVYLGDKNL